MFRITINLSLKLPKKRNVTLSGVPEMSFIEIYVLEEMRFKKRKQIGHKIPKSITETIEQRVLDTNAGKQLSNAASNV
jgi:hypothetical protein